MSTESVDNRTKAQKAVPASLLKQLRATAAVLCYDYCFGLPSMPLSEFQRKVGNLYHGNEDSNMISQVELMCNGKGLYSDMYQLIQTLVTNNDSELGDGTISSTPGCLVLSPVLLNFDTHIRYVSGEHFTIPMLRCPTKTLTKELCTGRFILDLAKQTVANIKKASIIADEWLVNNEKPSGTVWEDLYKHLISNGDKINHKEKDFTGMAAFMCYSKYNTNGENMLNFLAKNDEDAVPTSDASRSQSRSSVKTNKDQQRSIESGDHSLFGKRGYTLDTRLQMVEIAQFEEAQARDDLKHDLEHLTSRNKLLLDEREQEINIAKIICPQYDRMNEHWERVNQVSTEISELKKEMILQQQKKIATNTSQIGNSMAAKFLASVQSSDNEPSSSIDSMSSSKKRPFGEIVDNPDVVDANNSRLKKTVTVDIDEQSSTSSMNTSSKKSTDEQSSNVSFV